MKFVIAFTARSGSTHLCQLLGSHYAVACWGEILNKRNRDLYQERGPHGALYGVFFQRHSPILAAGGKVAFGHSLQREFQAEPWGLLVNDTDIRVIQLRRRNILKQALSQEFSSQSKNWTESEKRLVAEQGLRVNPGRLVRRMEKIKRDQKALDECFANHLSVGVRYENLDERPEDTCRDLLQFLELEDFPLRSNMQKLNTKSLDQSVANFPELERHVSGTRWEKYLES